MILDLAKLFGVKEGELFTIKSSNLPNDYKSTKFVIKNNELFIVEGNKEIPSILRLNDINWNDFEINKIKERIKFSMSELFVLKLIHDTTELNYITKDDSEMWFFKDKPILIKEFGKLFWDIENSNPTSVCNEGNLLINVFKSLPDFTCVKIDDYCEEFNGLGILEMSFIRNDVSDVKFSSLF